MVDYREIIRLKSTKPEMSNTMIASSVGSEYSGAFSITSPVIGKRYSG